MDIIDLSTVATDDASFLDYIDQLCQKLGFDYASYATTSPMTGAVQAMPTIPTAGRCTTCGATCTAWIPPSTSRR